jgi:nucleoid-associated protein YgaU
MGISRYSILGKVKNGKGLETSANMSFIYQAVERGRLSVTVLVLEEGQRLDQLAGVFYNDSSYWWVISAASGIGWGLQVPPGTVVRIPNNLGDVLGLLS